jgi:hypothetical protein
MLVELGELNIYCTSDTLVTQNNMFRSNIQTLPQKSSYHNENPFAIPNIDD